MNNGTIDLQRNGFIATLVINRPAKLNALTPEMLVHLAAQLEEDDPLLLTMLDSWDISTTSGETLQRLESFMTEIGVEHE